MKSEEELIIKTTKYGEPLNSILNDMCKAVNIKLDDVDFTQEDWYLQNSWTMQQEKSFANELFKKVKSNKKLYSKVFKTSTDRSIKHSIEMFLFTYGWKYKK